MNVLRSLFGSGDFMSHGHCYLWNPSLVRLHLISDLAIGLAYVAISLTLVYLVRSSRRDIPFHWIFLAFGAFIIACGGTHFMEIWTLWTPVYWLSGTVKAVTACASVATALVLPPFVPRTLEMIRSAKLAGVHKDELERVNRALEQEIAERTSAEAEVRKLNEELEIRVQQRTAELASANLELQEKAAIVQHSGEAIFTSTLGGLITNWNPAAERMYGYRADEIVGKTAALLAPSKDADEFDVMLARLTTEDQPGSSEMIRLRKDGQVICVSATISPIRNNEGKNRGVCVIARDVTEQRKSEQQMREMQKLESLGLIAGGVAHDFNNLLVGILGHASLALEQLSPASPIRLSIEKVVAASERAAHLTRQLLAYAGKGRFVSAPLDLSQTVREISSLLQISIPKNVQLQMDLNDSLPPVEADPGQMQQLIMNLIMNGAEAIPSEQNGTVRVTTETQKVDVEYATANYAGETIKPGMYVTVQVDDTGVGMDASVQSKIFDPFFTTKFTGRGLGLSAVIGIVRGHNGTIRVHSVPGKGTTMKVLLPAKDNSARAPALNLVDSPLEGSGLVLVVDDEDVVRATAKLALQRYGYEVLVAENGQAGVDLFRAYANQIDVVLLDMTMPVMSGQEAFQHMRLTRSDVRVILSSGYNEVESVRRFTSKGLAGFLQKPYTAAQLALAVKRVVESGPQS